MATGTLGTSPRDYHTRQTHYISAVVTGTNFQTGLTPIKLGTIPAGSVITGASMVNRFGFNGTTDNNVRIGTNVSAAVIAADIAAIQSGGAAVGLTNFTLASSSSLAVIVDTDVYASIVQAAAGTTGQGVVFVSYVVP